MHLRHPEKQMTNISYYLEELSFHRIKKMRERFINDQIIIPEEFDELKIKLEKARSQLSVLQKKQLTPRNEISFTHFRISNLENIIREIRACHQMNQKNLQNAIHNSRSIRMNKSNSSYLLLSRTKPQDKELLDSSTGLNVLNQYFRVASVPKKTGSIEENVIAIKPQTLEEVITITQRLMEQLIKHQSPQEADDHKKKIEDRRNTSGNNNNHSNNHNNNLQDNRNNNNCNHNYHHQQNKRQEAIRAYAVNPTKDSWYAGNLPLCMLETFHDISISS
nr:hypothetical protein [Tanacetum cinerariifolium]